MPSRRSLCGIALLMTAIAIVNPATPTGVMGRAADGTGTDCVDGLRDITSLPRASRIKALARMPDGRVIGVGSVPSGGESGEPLRILTAWREADAWSLRVSDGPGGARAGLQALAVSTGGVPWAAGIRRASDSTQWPLVVRWTNGAWRDESPKTLAGYGTAIAVDPAGAVWVTTVEDGPSGPLARVYGRSGGTWTRVTLPAIPGVERFTAVAAPSRRRTLVAGSTVSGDGLQAVILARTEGVWRRERVEAGADHLVLSSLSASAGRPTLAAGWALAPGRVRPILLRRDADSVWRPIALTGGTGAAGVLMDLTGGPGADLAAGASYLTSAGQWVPAIADAGTDPSWMVAPRPGWFIQAVIGSPSSSSWLGLAATRKSGVEESMLARTCDLVPVDDSGLRKRLRAQRRRVLQRAKAEARRFSARAERASAAERRRHPVRMAPAGAVDGDLVLTDIAATLGLPTSSQSYGVDAGDVDGDGRKDLVWSRHGGGLAIYLRTDAGFAPYLDAGFAPADRHSCVAAPLDTDARADIACMTGGMSGLGISSGELYLDPTGGATRDTGTEHGLTDPVARGRLIATFDADGDQDLDLFVTGQDRPDGLPNVNRLLLNDGDAGFSWAAGSGLTSAFGAGSVDVSDIDGDGLTDLVVSQYRRSSSGSGIHLYRNQGGGVFRDEAAAVGLTTIDESDVAVAQLDGVGRKDIVQIASGRLVVRLWRKDRYVVALDRSVVRGHAVEAGDVDGDGDLDLYLQLGQGGVPVRDAILRNDGTGRGWSRVPVPGTLSGTPDAVMATDIDDDRRDEFVVVSGRERPGPLQVIDAS